MDEYHTISQNETARLSVLGIIPQHVLVMDGVAVSIVDRATFDRIVSDRDNGVMYDGRFICDNNSKNYSVSMISDDGTHNMVDGLTLVTASKCVLGYDYGRKKQIYKYYYSSQYRDD